MFSSEYAFEDILKDKITSLKKRQMQKLEQEWKTEKEEFVDMIKYAPSVIVELAKDTMQEVYRDPKTIIYISGIIGGILALREGLLRLDEYVTPYLPSFPEAELPPRLEEISEKLEPYANYFRYLFAMPVIPIIVKTTPLGSYFTVRNERKQLREIDAEQEARFVFSELKDYKEKISSCRSKKCAEKILDEIKKQKRKIERDPIRRMDYHHPDKFYLSEMKVGLSLLEDSIAGEFNIKPSERTFQS